MPKTKNISRSQWDHATHSNMATTSNHNQNTTTTTDGITAAAGLTSPPTRPRLHASRTNSNSAMATRHRRPKENSENAAPEKENNGRAGRSTRTHVTPGVLSTTFVSSNLATAFTSNSNSILSSKKVLASASASKPTKTTVTKRRVKKQPLQDVTAQFVASGMGEGANRAGTVYEHLDENDILTLRAQSGGDVVLEGPAAEARMATPGRGHRNQEPTSPLPPSSPPSDYRLPSSLNFNLAASVPLALPSTTKPAAPVSPAQSIPVPEYDPWDSFDSAPPVGSPTRPVAVAKPKEAIEQDEEDAVDEEDPFGFAALERKLKADRAEMAHVMHEDPSGPEDPARHEAPEEEDEDIDNILVADTSSPRPEGILLRRRSNLKRALEEELDEEDADAARASFVGSSPVVPPRIRAAALSSPVRAAIAAAEPASTPAEASPLHAHFATPPTPHKETHKRRRISSVPDGDVAHDVFGPCLPTSSSSPGQVQAESPSPTKGSVRRPAVATAPARALVQGDEASAAAGAGSGDALDVFNAALDARESEEGAAPMEEGGGEAVGRTLRPRASRAVLADSVKKETETRSASRGRGRGRGLGRGTSRGRGASQAHSRSRGRGRGATRAQAKEDEADEEVDSDEKFEKARQARIAYFRGLDEYEIETEDVYLI